MYRFMMPCKVSFLSCLMFRLWTLELLAHMYRFLMSNKVTFLSSDVHNLDIGIFGPYVQIFDEQKDYFSELPDIHTLDIGTFGPYGQIYDE
jgi:hypothetical protein